MHCTRCGHEPPNESRYCNLCGLRLGGAAVAPPPPRVEHRWLYLDLPAPKDAAYRWALEDRAELVAQLGERFVPFADDGWEWADDPADWRFAGWVYREADGCREIVGANLLCQRVRAATAGPVAYVAPHQVSVFRERQLTHDVERAEFPPDRLRPAGRHRRPPM